MVKVMKNLAKFGLMAVLSAGALTGCGLFEKEIDFTCPSAKVLGDAQRISQFKPGAGRDIIDVQFEAQIEGLLVTCTYDDDEKVLTATSKIAIVAERGPGAETDKTTFPFFVALLDSEENVVKKQVFDSPFRFQPGFRRGKVEEEIEQVFPKVNPKDGVKYHILIGFQLTEEQLKFNRTRRFQ